MKIYFYIEKANDVSHLPFLLLTFKILVAVACTAVKSDQKLSKAAYVFMLTSN